MIGSLLIRNVIWYASLVQLYKKGVTSTALVLSSHLFIGFYKICCTTLLFQFSWKPTYPIFVILATK